MVLKESKKKGGARPGAGMPKGYKTAKIRAREAGMRRVLAREALTAGRVLEELRRLAFSDVGTLFDPVTGKLRPIHTMTREERSAIAGVEVIVKNAEAGDGHTDTIHKVKVWDKPRSLEMLAKHFALLTERVDVTITGIDERIKAARRRIGVTVSPK